MDIINLKNKIKKLKKLNVIKAIVILILAINQTIMIFTIKSDIKKIKKDIHLINEKLKNEKKIYKNI